MGSQLSNKKKKVWVLVGKQKSFWFPGIRENMLRTQSNYSRSNVFIEASMQVANIYTISTRLFKNIPFLYHSLISPTSDRYIHNGGGHLAQGFPALG